MTPESLIFDIDGTLWDSRALVAQGYNLQLRAEGLDHLCVDAETLRPLFGKTMTEIADSLFGSIPEEARYSLMARCMETEQGYLRQNPCRIGYPGVKETLEMLSTRHRLFIVSNSEKGYPELTMDKLGIAHLFQGHLCFGDTGAHKGITIQRLMEAHGISDAVYIGDTQGDMEASYFAGIPFIFAAYGFGSPEKYNAKIDAFPALAEIF